MDKFVKTTIDNVVLGTRVRKNGFHGHKMNTNYVMWESGCPHKSQFDPDEEVETTYYSQIDKPELRHT